MSDSQPNGSQSSSIMPLTYIVNLCERFETEWRSGLAPRIETFLEGVATGEREKLLRELLAMEVELRISRGENPSFEKLLLRYPDWGHAITIALEKGRLAAEAAREGLVRAPEVRGDGNPLAATRRLDAGNLEHAGVTIGSVRWPDDGVPAADANESRPARLGRYEVISELGRGGFGTVYLGRDDELSRPVAIKVPRRGLIRSPQQVDSFLKEARNAAGLCHPAIVAVHDVGRFEDFGVFVVFEYVEGHNLAEVLGSERLSPTQIAKLLVPIAEAAHHAHRAGLVHRDLKPSNILIDAAGQPHITDFGLAVREGLQDLRIGEIAGTPHFMAPEQVRGENHRLDGRTDVWAIGVMLYRALLDRQPFAGRDYNDIFDEILHRDPKPPRQINDWIPRELERICLKCLSKRMADRHETAADLAEDLKRWMIAEASTDAFSRTPHPSDVVAKRAPIARIVPKGLRAFDVEDADFFLALVPGPRDSDGVPEVIRGWKRRIEERDVSRTFSVGLLYGPSGSGKSSLMKAGVIPRLSRHVRAIHVSASRSGTEGRIRAALDRELGEQAAGELDLVIAGLRERGAGQRGSKVLLVLDQFEQWLESHPDGGDAELVRALRQCDGVNCQAILLVRDEFWMATTRFLRAIEVQLVEGFNSAPVELFDVQHAGFVLGELGRTLGRVDDGPIAASSEAGRFIERAVKELVSRDGRVIPVRLVLFAEMVRHRDWKLKTLRALGGIEGIGETFLEESFSARSAPLPHRAHQRAAQAVLQALLPEARSDLRDRIKPVQMLREVSGYADRPTDFDELMFILDNELRMVTPIDPLSQGDEIDGAPAEKVERFYQLTHDYLVPSLRQWLSRKQRETRRGRAELQLASLSALWSDRPESRRLPSPREWLEILVFTRARTWTSVERRMMNQAIRHFAIRAAAGLLLAGLGIYAIATMRSREQAHDALKKALSADSPSLAGSLAIVRGYSATLLPELERMEASSNASVRERQIAALALYHDRPTTTGAEFLSGQLVKADADLTQVIGEALAEHPAQANIEGLRGVVFDDASEPGTRLRVACVLAKLEPGSVAGLQPIAAILAEALMHEQPQNVERWVGLLGPVAAMLDAPLCKICCDVDRDVRAQSSAAEVLAVLLEGEDRQGRLARLTSDATPEASKVLLSELVRSGASAESIEVLRNVMSERVAQADDELGKETLAGRQASAGIALAALGQFESLGQVLRHRIDPRLRTILIERLSDGALGTRVLMERLAQKAIDSTERQAILLAFAEMHRAAVPEAVNAAVIARSRVLYLDDPDAGVHSAAELLLSRWAGSEVIAEVRKELRSSALSSSRGVRWTLGPNEHTFAILEGPLEFQMGAPAGKGEFYGSPVLHYRKIDRTIAVATKEVTLRQFQQFRQGHQNESRYGDQPECAVINVSWFAAALYCNWLSKEAGIPRSEWCYPEKAEPGMILSVDAVRRTGFRMPTEAEWEYFCRADTQTARPFGESAEQLQRYAWTCLNSGNRVHPVGLLLPNEFGLFDVLGNAWEWCQDGPIGHYRYPETDFPAYPPGTKEDPADDPTRTETVDSIDRAHQTWRILRGGAYCYAPDRARSAYRDWQPSGDVREYLGLRVVRTLPRRTEVSSQ